MKSLAQLKTITSPVLIALTLACTGVVPEAQAVVPAPDGGYPGSNTAEGQNALLSLTSGQFNTAVGFSSLLSGTNSSFNTAIGAGTLLANTADENTAAGAGALLSNTSGDFNTANGAFALFNNTSGSGNTALGFEALLSGVGAFNTAVGFSALKTTPAALAISPWAMGLAWIIPQAMAISTSPAEVFPTNPIPCASATRRLKREPLSPEFAG